ncbi:YopX family protein [Enterococcus innesii]|uniref:YopX family protein n=1 Tax=Enterococcus innesii TaxID=2839759 RepID=UPI003D1000D0
MVSKFRAWDKENSRMVYPSTDDVYFELTDDGINILNMSVEPFDDVFPHLDAVLMQSTSLKDKNGVEIFEGDIVSVRNHPFQKTEKSGAGIEIDGDYAISWNEGDLTWCAGNLLLARLKPYVTVAGNVWENPELLEKADES